MLEFLAVVLFGLLLRYALFAGAFSQTVERTVTIDDTTFSITAEGTTGETAPEIDVELGPAVTGTLTTRTDNETGTLTMDEGHGITTGARLDLYWDDDEGTGATAGYRRGITVGTVSGNSVPIGADNSGAGDNLPANGTAIKAMVPHELDEISFAEANVLAFGITASGLEENTKAVLSFGNDSGSYTEGAAVILNGDDWGPTVNWSDTESGTSPLAAATTINTIFLSHGDTENTVTFTGKFLLP